MTRRKRAPKWAKPGAIAFYRPSLGEPTEHRGTIDEEPRLLGDTWVVRLAHMAQEYGRTTVAAAALSHCRRAESNDLDWEDRRSTKQVKLRLTPDETDELRACAARAGEGVSRCVARLVAEENVRRKRNLLDGTGYPV